MLKEATAAEQGRAVLENGSVGGLSARRPESTNSQSGGCLGVVAVGIVGGVVALVLFIKVVAFAVQGMFWGAFVGVPVTLAAAVWMLTGDRRHEYFYMGVRLAAVAVAWAAMALFVAVGVQRWGDGALGVLGVLAALPVLGYVTFAVVSRMLRRSLEPGVSGDSSALPETA